MTRSSALDVRERRIDVALWAAFGVCAAGTAWLSLWGVPPETSSLSFFDKIQHFTAYLVTTSLFYLAAMWRPGRGDGAAARFGTHAVIALVVTAGSIEVLQGVVDREAEVLDWVAGSVGGITAFALGHAFRRLRTRSSV